MISDERYTRIREHLIRDTYGRKGYWCLTWTKNRIWKISLMNLRGHKNLVGTLPGEASWQEALSFFGNVIVNHSQTVSYDALYDLLKLLQLLVGCIETTKTPEAGPKKASLPEASAATAGHRVSPPPRHS